MPKDVTVGEVIKELADKSLHRIILIESETNRKTLKVWIHQKGESRI